jgi:CRISPR-associated protein Cmr3
MRTVLLTPVDAWFFRDGRPYNQGESGQTDAHSLFPPFDPTVVGVIRASLALERGWNGRGPWDESLHEVLGNGFSDLGQLRFSGPFLKRTDRQHSEFLFPMPLHLLGTVSKANGDWSPATFLRPAGDPTLCDLGEVRLPEPLQSAENGIQLKQPTGLWITADGYSAILSGRLPKPDTIVRSTDLWKREPRVGLARHHETRTAEEGKLYSPQYVRLSKDVSLAVAVQGIPANWTFPRLTTFGGEGRMAYCDNSETPLRLPAVPTEAIRESLQFSVTLLTPLFLPADALGGHKHPLPGDVLPGMSGLRIVSGVIGKPIQVGGWNSLHREPLPLRAYLPAGSTWFCEAKQEAIDNLLEKHGAFIGDRTKYGFGQIALGTWPRNIGDKP